MRNTYVAVVILLAFSISAFPQAAGPNKVAGINSAGTAGEYKSILAGSGIAITHGTGTITIRATGGGGGVSYPDLTSPNYVPYTKADGELTISQFLNVGNELTETDHPYGVWDEAVSRALHIQAKDTTDSLQYAPVSLFLDAATWNGTANSVKSIELENKIVVHTVRDGTVATNGTTLLVGTGTKFLTEFYAGDIILVSGETERVVSGINDNNNLLVSSAFSTTASGLSYQVVRPELWIEIPSGTPKIRLGTDPVSFNVGRIYTNDQTGSRIDIFSNSSTVADYYNKVASIDSYGLRFDNRTGKVTFITPSYPWWPNIWITESNQVSPGNVGPLLDYQNYRPSIFMDLTNITDNANPAKTGIHMQVFSDRTSGQEATNGILVDLFTQEDSGGDVSGITSISYGNGNAGSFFGHRYSETLAAEGLNLRATPVREAGFALETSTRGNTTGITAGSTAGIGLWIEVGSWESSITTASNANPILVTTDSPHGLSSGEVVTISGVIGNSTANGVHYVKVDSDSSFFLYSDYNLTTPVKGAGSGTYGLVVNRNANYDYEGDEQWSEGILIAPSGPGTTYLQNLDKRLALRITQEHQNGNDYYSDIFRLTLDGTIRTFGNLAINNWGSFLESIHVGALDSRSIESEIVVAKTIDNARQTGVSGEKVSGVVTLYTTLVHDYKVGDTITVASMGSDFNVEDAVVTSVGPYSITYSLAGDDATGSSGVLTRTNNAHAFSDSSVVNRYGTQNTSGKFANNSFDSRGATIGTYDYDHVAGFQAGWSYGSSGTLDNYFGFVTIPAQTAGTITNLNHYFAYDTTQTAGTVTNDIAFRAQQLGYGTGTNYGVYTEGNTRSYFTGTVFTGNFGYNGLPTPVNMLPTSHHRAYGYHTTIELWAFTGSGLDDGRPWAGAISTAKAEWDVMIDGNGTPDTFKWRHKPDGGSWSAYTTGVPIVAGSTVTLMDGIGFRFTASTGHTIGDLWHWHTAGPDSAVLWDTTSTLKDWTVNEFAGKYIFNITQGVRGLIASNTSNSITATSFDGAAMEWNDGDAFRVEEIVGLYSGGEIWSLNQQDTNRIVMGADTDHFAELNYTAARNLSIDVWHGTNHGYILVPNSLVGIGVSTPETSIHTQGSSAALTIDRGADAGLILTRRYNGTSTSKTKVLADERIAGWVGSAWQETSAAYQNIASIDMYAAENQTSTTKGSYMIFQTADVGNNARAERMRIDHDGKVGIGTNSPKRTLDVSSGATNSTNMGLIVSSTDVNYHTIFKAGPDMWAGTVSGIEIGTYNYGPSIVMYPGSSYFQQYAFGHLQMYSTASFFFDCAENINFGYSNLHAYDNAARRVLAFGSTSVTPPDNPVTNTVMLWAQNVTSVGSVTFTGGGLNDATSGGTYTYASAKNYRVQIDGTGTPDTFKWSDDGGSTWDATTVSITGSAQTLNEGVTITFSATTGHTVTDRWDFTAAASSELKAEDEAGNITTITPHTFSLFTPSKDYVLPWSYYSKNEFVGKEINVDMYGAIAEIEKLSGKKFIYIKDLDKSIDWDDVQQKAIYSASITETKEDTEITKEEALELKTVEIETETGAEKESVVYVLNNATGNVEPVTTKEPVKTKSTIQQYVLKPGIRIDKNTGKFIGKKKGSYTYSAPPEWIKDRVKK